MWTHTFLGDKSDIKFIRTDTGMDERADRQKDRKASKLETGSET